MRKLIPLLLFVLALSGVAEAIEQSVTYMPLVSSETFLQRIEFNVVKWIDAPAGGGVGPMLEATSVACHTRRIQYARNFLASPLSTRVEVAKHLITQTVVLSNGTTGTTGTSNFDSAATDAALFSAVSASWSAFSGCDVNNQ